MNTTQTQTEAERIRERILAALDEGHTVVIATRTHRIPVKPATIKKWRDAGRDLFRLDPEGNLRIARGRSYDIIATPSARLVRIAVFADL